MVLPIIAGVGQGLLGIFGGMSSSANEAASAAYNNTYQNLMIDAGNRQRRQIFGRQLDQAKMQMGFNADAANRAYSAEQRRLNEQFTAAAFQRQGMLQNLIEAQGYNNATESYGNSARRANLINTLGQFGRQQAIMADSLASARGQSARNMQEIGRQNLSADFQTWQGVSIPPTMEANVPAPRINSANTALMIGNSLMSGLNTYMGLRAPSGGNIGFNPPRSTAFPSSMNTNTSLAFSLPNLASR
jgi:hypothetical protein